VRDPHIARPRRFDPRRWRLAFLCALPVAFVLAAGATTPAPVSMAVAPDPAAAEVAARLPGLDLPEPLVATGPTNAAEDTAVLAAATRYQNRADPDDF
jgi:hypothetical protein